MTTQWKPYSLGPPLRGVNHIGAITNSRYAQAAAIRLQARPSARTTSPGRIQTQWWVHEMGDTSRPVNPVATAAPSQSPARASAAAMTRPTTPRTAGIT